MSTVTTKTRVLADVGLFWAAAIWGSTFFIVKDVLNDIDPIILVGYRFTFAGVILLAYVLYTGRKLNHHWGPGVFLSVVLWLLYIPQTIGLEYTTASNSGFITGLFVAFVPIFMWLIFHRRPGRIDLAATAVALSGLWVLTGGMHDINLGDILTLFAAVTYALHILYVDRFLKKGADPFVLTCQQFLLVGIFSLVIGLVLDLPFEIGSTKAIGVVLFLAIFPTFTAFLIQVLAQKITAPFKVSLIFSMEPVFAAIFAWTLGGEHFVTHRALGGLLIFSALVLSSFAGRRHKAAD
jgi:drug/metabolite transporter (DMT)-like permease